MKTCWYSGVILLPKFTKPRQRLMQSQSLTVEHLIPLSSHPERILQGKKQDIANRVYASHLMNSIVGSAPLSIKVEIKEAALGYMGDRHDYTSGDIRSLKALVKSIFIQYRIKDKTVWQENYLKNHLDDIRVFSLENPYANFTPEDIAQREVILKEIAGRDRILYEKLFGLNLSEEKAYSLVRRRAR